MEEVREVAGGGCGGDKVHLGSITLSQGIDQSQIERNICCVVSEQQDAQASTLAQALAQVQRHGLFNGATK